MNFEKAVYKYRKKLNLSQREFGKRLNLTQAQVSYIEKRNASLYNLQKIADAFNINLIVLLWEGITIEDVKEEKKEAYNVLKDSLSETIKNLFS